MLYDLNLDEFNNTMITRNGIGKSMTTDSEYWQIRNYLINRFCRTDKFWNKFKNIKIYNRTELEKNIEENILDYVTDEIRNKIKVVALIENRKVTVYFIHVSVNIYKKDKLLFDFKITV